MLEDKENGNYMRVVFCDGEFETANLAYLDDFFDQCELDHFQVKHIVVCKLTSTLLAQAHSPSP